MAEQEIVEPGATGDVVGGNPDDPFMDRAPMVTQSAEQQMGWDWEMWENDALGG